MRAIVRQCPAVPGASRAKKTCRFPIHPRVRLTALCLGLAVLAQIGLGIWTLLAEVPLGLGLAHQAGAAALLAFAVAHAHAMRRV